MSDRTKLDQLRLEKERAELRLAQEQRRLTPVSYTHLTLPTMSGLCRSRWSPYH